MKKLLATSIAAALFAMASGAQAATANNTFNVNMTLTPVCTVGVIADIDIAYDAGVGTTSNTGGGYNVTCTTGVFYNLSVDAGGTAAGIAYTLATTAAQQTGSGIAQAHTVVATVAAAQAGACAAGVCTGSNVHTVTVTY